MTYRLVIPRALYPLVLRLYHRSQLRLYLHPLAEADWVQGTRGSITEFPLGI